MKRILCAFISVLTMIHSLLAQSQMHKMVITENIHCVNDSQDARINKVDDGNGNLCALLKITLSDSSFGNSFHAVPGGYIPVKKSAIEPTTGELWYWIPANIQSLTFTCADHEPYKMNVKLESGKVYRMSIKVQSRGTYVQDFTLTSDFVKFNVSPAKVRIYYGESTEYKDFIDVTDGAFYSDYAIEYGKTVFIKIVPEDKLYQPYETSIVWDGKAIPDIKINESFNKISVTTTPDNAEIFIDGNKVSDLPNTKIPKGKHRMTVKKSLWYPIEQEIDLPGDGMTKNYSFDLKPRSAMVTITCPDALAEIFVDNETSPRGKGNVTVRLSSGTHKISSRRPGHATQEAPVTVKDGVDCSCQVLSPVAMYGAISIMTSPKGCDVYVDGQKVGTSPMMHKCMTGSHTLEFKKEGYTTKKLTVQVDYNATKSLNETLAAVAPVAIAGGAAAGGAAVGGASNSSLPQGFENAVNLSASGTANCYIVSKAGKYAFNASVKGSSNKPLDGTPVKAEVLWESFGTSTKPSVGDLVNTVSYSGGYVTFTATSNKGNAVIAVKNSSGTILWSWHIWLTDAPSSQAYKNSAGTMMDRNLGATSATPGDVKALGLLYQWGRKDPFLGSSSISSNTIAASTLSWPSSVSSDASNGTIAYAVAHPTTFITYNSNNYDWYYTGSSSTDNTRWRTSSSDKGVYDPCPPGWRVPDGGASGVWSKAFGSSSSYSSGPWDSTNKGMNFGSGNGKSSSMQLGSSSTIWYPASGYRDRSGGSLYYVGDSGYYWSCTPYSGYAYGLYFRYNGYVFPSFNYYRAYGQGVRCLSE